MEEQSLNPTTADRTENPVAAGTSSSSSSSSISELPNNILVDILSRLPIISILHCKRVCKSFHHLISQDPEFPPLHLSKSPPELLLCSPNMEKLIIVDSDADNAHELNLPFDGMEVVNSSRGLLCLRPRYFSEPVCVLNPITLEFTLIPNPLIRKEDDRIPVWVGLGYSPMSDEYKVLKLLKVRNSDGNSCFAAEIYTLGGTPSSWRRIESCCPLDELTCCFSTFLNGCLHLVMNEHTSNYYYAYMLTFDLDNETFGVTALPPPFDVSSGVIRGIVNVLSFGVFEGLLSVSVLNDDDGSFTVWVMMEYGVPESWCRKFAVDTSSICVPKSIGCLLPVKHVNNNEAHLLLFIVDNILVTFNILEMKIDKLNSLSSTDPLSNAFMYVPTLLSLKELVVGADVHLLKPTGSKEWRRCRDWLVSTSEETASLGST